MNPLFQILEQRKGMIDENARHMNNPLVIYKCRRDEIIGEAVKHINSLRPEGMKKETAATLARRVNLNPFLRSTDELSLLIKECKEKGNYKKLYYMLKTK